MAHGRQLIPAGVSVAASAVFFLNARGDIIIQRVYRDDVTRHLAEAFRTQILLSKEAATVPVHSLGSCSFMYAKENNVYVVLVTKTNANAALAFKFLFSMVGLFKSYFNRFDEDALRNNFVLIYELLDEILDFGYPQVLDPDLLKQYITQESVRSKNKDKSAEDSKNTTMQVTGAVGWRREGLKYKKNEVYLDIVEDVNLLMSSKGTILRSEVNGRVLMKCLLSGMPELKLGLNDKLGMENDASGRSASGKMIELDDTTFHQCVNLSKFASEKVVTFVPPDGEFEAMRYRVTDGVTLPFRVLPIIKELGRTRIQVNVKLKSCFAEKLFAMGVKVVVPVPKTTAKATIEVSGGKAKWKSALNALVWKVKRFQGQEELTLSAEVELIATLSDKQSWQQRPPINIEFGVPMFTASGLRVRFLKVWDKSGYTAVKWVRYITRAGATGASNYEIRTSDYEMRSLQ